MSEPAALADQRVELLRPQPDSLPAGVIPRQPQTHPRSESLFRETTELKTRQSEKQTRTRSLESSGSDLESCQAQLDALQLEATQSVKEARQRPEIRLAENTGELIASFRPLIAGPASRVQPIVLGTQSEQLMQPQDGPSYNQRMICIRSLASHIDGREKERLNTPAQVVPPPSAFSCGHVEQTCSEAQEAPTSSDMSVMQLETTRDGGKALYEEFWGSSPDDQVPRKRRFTDIVDEPSCKINRGARYGSPRDPYRIDEDPRPASFEFLDSGIGDMAVEDSEPIEEVSTETMGHLAGSGSSMQIGAMLSEDDDPPESPGGGASTVPESMLLTEEEALELACAPAPTATASVLQQATTPESAQDLTLTPSASVLHQATPTEPSHGLTPAPSASVLHQDTAPESSHGLIPTPDESGFLEEEEAPEDDIVAPVRVSAKRGRPTKAKKAKDLLPELQPFVRNAANDVWVPLDTLYQANAFTAHQILTRHLVLSRENSFKTMHARGMNEINHLRPACVECQVGTKQRYNCNTTPSSFEACDKCLDDAKNPCGRLIEHPLDGEGFAVGFLPLPEDLRSNRSWGEEGFWIRPQEGDWIKRVKRGEGPKSGKTRRSTPVSSREMRKR